MTDHESRFPPEEASPDDPPSAPEAPPAEEEKTERVVVRPEPTTGIPWRLGLFLALTVVVVIFAVQNTQEVVLEFLGWSWRLPLVIIITITVVVSVILDEILGGIIKRQQRRRRLEREELKRLRGEE